MKVACVLRISSLSCRDRSPPLSPPGIKGREALPAANPHPVSTDTPSHHRLASSIAILPSAKSQSSNMASHQQPMSAAREKGGVATRVRSREADAEAAVAEQPAKRSRTSKWDQQDLDAVPAVALPVQVGSVHESAAYVKAVSLSQATMQLHHVIQQDGDAVPAVALRAQVGAVHDSADCVKALSSSQGKGREGHLHV